MEASRLVFVFVRDAKVKRKVAVPVPDGYSWQEFIQQVTTKLKIHGVKEIYLAASGQRVTQLDELQDIDELCVVEGSAINPNGAPPPGSEAALRSGVASTSEVQAIDEQMMAPGKHKMAMADSARIPVSGADDQHKYTKRTRGPLRRVLQRMFPKMFAPGLPVSVKDVAGLDDKGSDARGRRRRRRGVVSAASVMMFLLIVFIISTMLYMLFFRVAPVANQ